MTPKQNLIQSFVQREIVTAVSPFGNGSWVADQTASRFRSAAERAAIGYVEDQAIREAVAAVLGVENPAVPFVALGIKQVVDEETPAIVRFANQHPGIALAAACLVLFAVVKFGSSA